MKLRSEMILYTAGVAVVLFAALSFAVFWSSLAGFRSDISADMSAKKRVYASEAEDVLAENGLSADENGFRQAAQEICSRISGKYGCTASLYCGGVFLCSSDGAVRETDSRAQAEGESFHYETADGKTTVHMLFDLGAAAVGTDEDYTAKMEARVTLRNATIAVMGVITLAVTGAAVFIILTRMSVISSLTEQMKKTARNPEKAEELDVKRKDEVGNLVSYYNSMAREIRSQIETIRTERDAVRRSYEYSKSFYDNLTHELKTPITIILGYAEMMKETDFGDSEFVRKGTDEIISESRRLHGMVTELLEQKAGASSVKERTDVSKIASDVASAMDLKAKRYGSRIVCDSEAVCVYAYPERIREVIVNLVDNAVKYGRAGADILVHAGRNGEHAEISVRNLKDAANPFDGSGKYFLPFHGSREQGRSETGSVGLGLSIVKKIVEENGGNIVCKVEGDSVEILVTLAAV